MKITGKMLYQVYAKHAKQHSVDFWEWDEVKPGTQSFYEGIAEDLSTMLAEHQTQPLVAEQQYEKRYVTFASRGLGDPYVEVDSEINDWFALHPDAIIINHAANVNVSANNVAKYTVSLLVELPVPAERPDPYQDCRAVD